MQKQYSRTANFVAPSPKPRVEIIPIEDPTPMLPTAHTSVELHTTYTDRAKGFQLATLPISAAFGVGALIGWAIHHVASPDGVALIQSLLMYRYVRREQVERHRRYQSLHDKNTRGHYVE